MFIRWPTTVLCFFSWMILFFGSLPQNVHAKLTDNSGWYQLETRHTMIHYQSIGDLKRFNRKIAYRVGNSGVLSKIFKSDSETLQEIVRKKVDSIFEKAQQILDMRKRMAKVQIYICRNQKQLHDNYFKIYRRPCRYRAWYAYELNTVFVNYKDIDEGMLSHELAHSIIDHCLLVRPPRASAEILARYVHLHLFD